MKKEITNLAAKNLKRIRSFQIVSTVFASVAIVLFIISFQMQPGIRFWVNFPTIVLIAVLAIIYVGLFGFSKDRGTNLSYDEEKLEEEIARIYIESTEGLELREDITMEDRLELLELERIKERVDIRNDNQH